jgi:hypothetical protein
VKDFKPPPDPRQFFYSFSDLFFMSVQEIPDNRQDLNVTKVEPLQGLYGGPYFFPGRGLGVDKQNIFPPYPAESSPPGGFIPDELEMADGYSQLIGQFFKLAQE